MNYVPSGGSWDLGGPNVTNENTTDEKIVDHETDALYPKLDGLYTPPGWTPEMTKWYNEHNGSFAKAGTPAAKYEDAVRKGWNNPDDYFQSFEDVMSSIYDEAYELIVEKQRGYGSKNIEQLGLYGVFSRVAYDKIERLKKALSGTVENGVVHIETTPELNDAVEDAALDIINYMVIFIALWRGLWGKPLQEELELERGY